MIVRLQQLIPSDEARKIAQALEDETFIEGDLSAGYAREVKNNRELSPESEIGQRYRTELNRHLWQHNLFASVAMPKRILECIFSRYEVGMEYGDHIDNTVMQMADADPVR